MDPLLVVIGIAAAVSLFCWVASIITKDTSWVDRLWSIVPAVHVWVFAVAALVAGEDATRRQILAYSVLLAPVGVAPALLGFASPVYGAIAAVLGVAFVWYAVKVFREREGDAARKAAVQLFKFSLLYLFLVFALLLGDSLFAALFSGGFA